MQKNKFLVGLVVLAFGWLSCITVFAQGSNDPVQLLQYVADGMVAGLKKNEATLKTKPQIVYNLAYQFVVPHADLAEMSKRVLPPQIWNSATATQRQQFQRVFTTTLIRTYASSLTNYKDQVVKFYPVRGGSAGKATVEVNSEIQSSGNSPIQVTYSLVKSGGGWKLIDMSVEGVDMLESFRSQFADILSQGNMTQLLQRLESHNTGPRAS